MTTPRQQHKLHNVKKERMNLNTRLVTVCNEVVYPMVLNRRLCGMAEKSIKDDGKALAETETGYPVRLKRVPTTPLRRPVCLISYKVHSRLDVNERRYNHCSTKYKM
jgi:hypothetical protein